MTITKKATRAMYLRMFTHLKKIMKVKKINIRISIKTKLTILKMLTGKKMHNRMK